MIKAVKSIVVVGGGTAGWITAGLIAAEHRTSESKRLEVTLIESPNINIVGVGEGTWPTMRATLSKLGISESDFIRECNSTFKQGAKFARWVNGSQDDFYYHPLMIPQGFTNIDLAPYWSGDEEMCKQSFSNAVCFQEQLCENNLAPKLITTAEYIGVANYAYHVGCWKISKFYSTTLH